jgi:hypothetical protein
MKQTMIAILIGMVFSFSGAFAGMVGETVKAAVTPVSSSDTSGQAIMGTRSYSVAEALHGDGLKAAREAVVGVAAEAASVPTAVMVASEAGVAASTGTAVASLSGAAASSATLAAIGSSAIGTTLGSAAAAAGIVAAPAVVGGAIVVGVAAGIAYGVNALIDWW